jgi:hypothetical protein
VAGGRAERVTDLYFLDSTGEGDPSEEGLIRYVSNDLVGYINGTVVSLTTGTGLSPGAHKTLRQLIHFIDDGPAGGFASGAYKETAYSGAFVIAEVWWESSGKLKKIVSLDITYTGINPTTEEWKMYDTDGSTVLVTVTDTIVYSGVFEQNRTRAIA